MSTIEAGAGDLGCDDAVMKEALRVGFELTTARRIPPKPCGGGAAGTTHDRSALPNASLASG